VKKLTATPVPARANPAPYPHTTFASILPPGFCVLNQYAIMHISCLPHYDKSEIVLKYTLMKRLLQPATGVRTSNGCKCYSDRPLMDEYGPVSSTINHQRSTLSPKPYILNP